MRTFFKYVTKALLLLAFLVPLATMAQKTQGPRKSPRKIQADANKKKEDQPNWRLTKLFASRTASFKRKMISGRTGRPPASACVRLPERPNGCVRTRRPPSFPACSATALRKGSVPRGSDACEQFPEVPMGLEPFLPFPPHLTFLV